MSKEIIVFGNIEVEKHRFHQYKRPFELMTQIVVKQ